MEITRLGGNMVFIPSYIYNLFFFCLRHTAEINRTLVSDEFQYPSNDTILRSFYFSMPVNTTQFIRNSSNFLLLPQWGLWFWNSLLFASQLWAQSKQPLLPQNSKRLLPSSFPAHSQRSHPWVNCFLPVQHVPVRTGTQILASGWGFSHKTSPSSSFISILCGEKHQEDDLLSAYLWHFWANLSIQNVGVCLLVQIRVTWIYGLAVKIIEALLWKLGIFFTPLQQPVRKWEWHHWPNTVKRKEKPNRVNLMILIFRVNEDLPFTQAPHTSPPFRIGITEKQFWLFSKRDRQCMEPIITSRRFCALHRHCCAFWAVVISLPFKPHSCASGHCQGPDFAFEHF